jgi:hypothetical protein
LIKVVEFMKTGTQPSDALVPYIKEERTKATAEEVHDTEGPVVRLEPIVQSPMASPIDIFNEVLQDIGCSKDLSQVACLV